jgi:hypothetical protein
MLCCRFEMLVKLTLSSPFPPLFIAHSDHIFSLRPQRVPVDMHLPVPAALMSVLEASSSTSDVKELPLWLAKGLKKSNLLSVQVPKTYGPRSLQKIKAGAAAVSLGQHHPYFYEVGIEVAMLDKTQEAHDMLKTLEAAFSQRYKNILDRFHNTGNTVLLTIVIYSPLCFPSFLS